ncbi:cytochrome b [Arenibaculum pallidiluteum]|uniref:cytochrome b n=1 Tax=Arenibaculum pallidiluteum TaxID=2812559 RepID=UPI001F32F5A9|nr:cytochrome b [Arenibaculum pallidiluteum]
MRMREVGAPEYRWPAKALHWTTVVLLLIVLPMGAVIKFVKDEVKLDFYAVHESLGLVVLAVMLVRLVFRLLNPPPPHDALPAPLRVVAGAVHWLLYAALIAMPVSGFLATNAWGFPLRWFGLFPVPSPLGEDKAIAPLLSAVHETLGWTILVLLALHVGGVLFHHVLRRDGTLHRML